MTPKNSTEIFSYICHIIFAIIIATSYDSTTQVFMNSEKPFSESFESIIQGLEIILAYVVVISGWVGYSRSMLKWPHKDTKNRSYTIFTRSSDFILLFWFNSICKPIK